MASRARQTAPAVDIVTGFVNTRDVLEGTDSLTTTDDLSAWLATQGYLLTDGQASAADVRLARELREALRTLLLANNGVDTDVDAASGVLDTVARRAGVELRFSAGRAEFVPQASGATGALGRVVVAVHATMADGSWERLKACRATDCHWAFRDAARNHSRAWCSMSECGNRAKVRAYRRRHRATGP
jgi:predicted RNA-binding Zn ribbon-like protein